MPTVLLVEDEALIALVVGEALEDAGYCVEIAHSAAEAYARLEPEPRSFSIVVTDVNLGGGDNGFCVGRRACELNPDVQVAYITGRPENFDGFDAGRALLFSKPFDPQQLVHELGLLIPA